jgi:2-pyrone-4,6-dicarboxylate lactonase
VISPAGFVPIECQLESAMAVMPDFVMDMGWRVWHPTPAKPSFVPPPGAGDAHCNVFGPGDVFPYAASRKYTPCDASKNDLWALRTKLGFSRSVIVQATCHGADNRALIDAIAHSHGTARGVASVGRNVTDEELMRLHAAGIRGVRFNFVKRLADASPRGELQEIAKRITPLGWHIVIYFVAEELEELSDFFLSLPAPLVVDHMGTPDVSEPADGPKFDRFVELMAARKDIWCKVTCPERLSKQGPPLYADVAPFGRRIVEAFPDRVLWGTDWPHPNMKTHTPDEGQLVDFIPKIATTADLRHRLLVANPMRLYWSEQLDFYSRNAPGGQSFPRRTR